MFFTKGSSLLVNLVFLMEFSYGNIFRPNINFQWCFLDSPKIEFRNPLLPLNNLDSYLEYDDDHHLLIWFPSNGKIRHFPKPYKGSNIDIMFKSLCSYFYTIVYVMKWINTHMVDPLFKNKVNIPLEICVICQIKSVNMKVPRNMIPKICFFLNIFVLFNPNWQVHFSAAVGSFLHLGGVCEQK